MLDLHGHLRVLFESNERWIIKCEEKDAFDLAVDGPLEDAIKGAPLNFKFGSLRTLYILYRTEQTKLLTFSN